jgi:hypothetical protein
VPRNHLCHGLRLLGILLVATLMMACSDITDFITRRSTVSNLLARTPSPGQTVEIDAYFSGAGRASPGDSDPAPDAVDRGAILSDQPFLPELTVLGSSEANALPADEPWLLAVPGPGAPALAQLPYDARFRGHLQEPSPEAQGTTAGRVFVVEQVVHVHAQSPPATQEVSDYTSWRPFQVREGGYSVPQPPRWRVEQPDAQTLVLRAPQWRDCPITVRTHPGETHHDPYDPSSATPLLQGRQWSTLLQASALGGKGPANQGLAGYRIKSDAGPGECVATVLFSGHGKTYELSVRYPLGFAAAQPLLTAYSAIVAGFRLDTPPGPTPTPPVRQALGPGPFVDQGEIVKAACDRCRQEIESAEAKLVSEAEARQLAGECSAFTGHIDGVWVLTVRTPAATRTQTMRFFYDATTGRELCREEIEPVASDEATPAAEPGKFSPTVATVPGADRWIEVNLAEQSLTAWEGDTPVRQLLICTGMEDTPTVAGEFRIYRKIRIMTMTGGGYAIPGIPHCQFFYEGYAFHGAYWRPSFGVRASHGCVNMPLPDAAWLWDWTGPQLPEGSETVDATVCNPGTRVVVH